MQVFLAGCVYLTFVLGLTFSGPFVYAFISAALFFAVLMLLYKEI